MSRARPARVLGPLAVVVALALPATAPTSGTTAAWNDTASVAAAASDALVVPPPAGVTCARVNDTTLRLSWRAASGATGYTLYYAVGSAGGTQQASFGSGTLQLDYAPGNTSRETAYLVTNRAFGSVTWSSVASTSVGYRLRNGRAECG